jgi:hypothetical protein
VVIGRIGRVRIWLARAQRDRLSLLVGRWIDRLAGWPSPSGTRLTLRERVVGAGQEMTEGGDLHQGAGMHGHPTFNPLTIGSLRGAQVGICRARAGANGVIQP